MSQEIIQILKVFRDSNSFVHIVFGDEKGEQQTWKGRIARLQKRFVLIKWQGQRAAIKYDSIIAASEANEPGTEAVSETEEKEPQPIHIVDTGE